MNNYNKRNRIPIKEEEAMHLTPSALNALVSSELITLKDTKWNLILINWEEVKIDKNDLKNLFWVSNKSIFDLLDKRLSINPNEELWVEFLDVYYQQAKSKYLKSSIYRTHKRQWISIDHLPESLDTKEDIIKFLNLLKTKTTIDDIPESLDTREDIIEFFDFLEVWIKPQKLLDFIDLLKTKTTREDIPESLDTKEDIINLLENLEIFLRESKKLEGEIKVNCVIAKMTLHIWEILRANKPGLLSKLRFNIFSIIQNIISSNNWSLILDIQEEIKDKKIYKWNFLSKNILISSRIKDIDSSLNKKLLQVEKSDANKLEWINDQIWFTISIEDWDFESASHMAYEIYKTIWKKSDMWTPFNIFCKNSNYEELAKEIIKKDDNSWIGSFINKLIYRAKSWNSSKYNDVELLKMQFIIEWIPIEIKFMNLGNSQKSDQSQNWLAFHWVYTYVYKYINWLVIRLANDWYITEEEISLNIEKGFLEELESLLKNEPDKKDTSKYQFLLEIIKDYIDKEKIPDLIKKIITWAKLEYENNLKEFLWLKDKYTKSKDLINDLKINNNRSLEELAKDLWKKYKHSYEEMHIEIWVSKDFNNIDEMWDFFFGYYYDDVIKLLNSVPQTEFVNEYILEVIDNLWIENIDNIKELTRVLWITNMDKYTKEELIEVVKLFLSEHIEKRLLEKKIEELARIFLVDYCKSKLESLELKDWTRAYSNKRWKTLYQSWFYEQF